MLVEGVPPPHIASILQTPQALRAAARERRRSRPVGGAGATEPPDEADGADDVIAPAAAEAVHNDLSPGPHPMPLPHGPPHAGAERAGGEEGDGSEHLDVTG